MGNSPLLSLPKHRKLCQLTQTRALTRVFFPLPLLKTPASPSPISSVVSGLPGGKQEAGAGQGPDEERSARGARAPPAVPGFLHPLLMSFGFGGRLRQPCEAQGSPSWGVESSGLISRPATHSAPGGVAAARPRAQPQAARSGAVRIMLSNHPIPQQNCLLYTRLMGLCEPPARLGCPAYPRKGGSCTELPLLLPTP